jgi:hypothetical protein
MARCWGNIRHGFTIVREDEDSRQIRAQAWDTQTNATAFAETQFAKLIFRKNGGWQKPDERDLRELTNRQAAILVRNCILSLMPSDLVEDAVQQAAETLSDRAAKDPDGERKRIILAFSELSVSPEMLNAFLKHPLTESSPQEIAQLRKMYASIRDGNSKWSDYGEQSDTSKSKDVDAALKKVTGAATDKNASAKSDAAGADGDTKLTEQNAPALVEKHWKEANPEDLQTACKPHQKELKVKKLESMTFRHILKLDLPKVAEFLTALTDLKEKRDSTGKVADTKSAPTKPQNRDEFEAALKAVHAKATPEDLLQAKSATGAKSTDLDAFLQLPDEDVALAYETLARLRDEREKHDKK